MVIEMFLKTTKTQVANDSEDFVECTWKVESSFHPSSSDKHTNLSKMTNN